MDPVRNRALASIDDAGDVLILGGGVIGLGAALALHERGVRVAVVERGTPGAEASSAAGGILAPQCEAHGPGPMLELCLRSRAAWPAYAAALEARTGIDVAYRDEGTLAVALDEAQAEKLVERLAWQRAAGLRCQVLEPASARELEPRLGDCVLAAHFPGDHQVDNLRVVRALAQAVAQAGVPIVRAEARRVLHQGGRVAGVELDGEIARAAEVVLACGSWSTLVPGAGLPPSAVVPVRGQMIEFELQAAPLRHVIFGDDGYLVPRKDGRVLCGSTEEHAGWVKEVTPAGLERLRARAARLCPPLGTRPIARSWSGLRPGTPDGLPLLGPSPIAGLHLATGHYRNGILLLPLTAEIVAASVTGATAPLSIAPYSAARLG
jgi:glycine oxidase